MQLRMAAYEASARSQRSSYHPRAYNHTKKAERPTRLMHHTLDKILLSLHNSLRTKLYISNIDYRTNRLRNATWHLRLMLHRKSCRGQRKLLQECALPVRRIFLAELDMQKQMHRRSHIPRKVFSLDLHVHTTNNQPQLQA